MRKKIALYFIFVLLFVAGKLGFMSFHSEIFGAYSWSDWLDALWHGLPHDLTCAGYVMALPFLLELVRAWIDGRWHTLFMRGYLRVIVVLVLLNYLADLVLYGAWGFRLDGTVMVYLLDNPMEALGQGTPLQWAVGLVALAMLSVVITWPLLRMYQDRGFEADRRSFRAKIGYSFVSLLVCGLVFVAIRGGITTSTMNIGRVYFSTEMPLNHAATNPLFSFCSTLGKQKRFDKQYRFMKDEEATMALEQLRESLVQPDSVRTSAPVKLLTNERPNILLVILEGFSGAASRVLHPEISAPSYMPNLDNLYAEGVGFTNFYANSFRTDRGVASVLASYPGQPNNSVMKDQKKCNNLQYLSKRLKENDYQLKFIHGGDVNFTNMKGFLTAGGFTEIVGDTDFPVSDRLSKWGVPDHIMFDYLYEDIVNEQSDAPFFKCMLTLSSHEPFDVEYHHYDDPYCNSVAYTDSCLGSFVDKLKQTPQWDNLLVIFVPDHCFARYPETINNHEAMRYHIPMVWGGGAVQHPLVVETLGQQTDLSATLLGQMGIAHDDFNFSKDMFDASVPHYAFYSFSDGFGFLTEECRYIQDNANDGCPLSGSQDPQGTAELWGKAYLQKLYDDLQSR
ncbi:MAG: LTA synthase family protein [Bacteroidales bacterium]|nr:LTA synthase family protein [Bacteroidales bacterium]